MEITSNVFNNGNFITVCIFFGTIFHREYKCLSHFVFMLRNEFGKNKLHTTKLVIKNNSHRSIEVVKYILFQGEDWVRGDARLARARAPRCWTSPHNGLEDGGFKAFPSPCKSGFIERSPHPWKPPQQTQTTLDGSERASSCSGPHLPSRGSGHNF